MISDDFKDVVGLEDYFMISKFGDLWSKRSNRLLKLNTVGSGYVGAVTRIGGRHGKAIMIKCHRAVAMAWIENPDNKPYVNHKDANKSNNIVCNLEWVTAQENSDHAVEMDLLNVHLRCGIKNVFAKLTISDIMYIRLNAKQNGGQYTQRELSDMFNVHHTNIGKAIREVSYQ